MKGKAQQIVSMTPESNGWEALRLIYMEFRPRSNVADHAKMIAILRPRWWQRPPHSQKPFIDVLRDWKQMIIEYEMSTKEKVTESMRCATVLGFGPTAIVKLLQGASYGVRHSFAMMEDTIKEATTDDADVLIPGMGSDPMDVTAI
eukprot:1186336-Karenia_brevis.AAC.1